MGDAITNKSKAERAAEREARRKKSAQTENKTIETIADSTSKKDVKKPGGKDLAISARVNSDTFKKFKEICAERGITSNACINMLITDFVRENKSLIEKEAYTEQSIALQSISLDFKNQMVCFCVDGKQRTLQKDMKKIMFYSFISEGYRDCNSFSWNFEFETFEVNEDYNLQEGCIMDKDCFVPKFRFPMPGLKKRLDEFVAILGLEKKDLEM